MFHRDKPVDWLLDHILWVKVCNPEKDVVRPFHLFVLFAGRIDDKLQLINIMSWSCALFIVITRVYMTVTFNVRVISKNTNKHFQKEGICKLNCHKQCDIAL